MVPARHFFATLATGVISLDKSWFHHITHSPSTRILSLKFALRAHICLRVRAIDGAIHRAVGVGVLESRRQPLRADVVERPERRPAPDGARDADRRELRGARRRVRTACRPRIGSAPARPSTGLIGEGKRTVVHGRRDGDTGWHLVVEQTADVAAQLRRNLPVECVVGALRAGVDAARQVALRPQKRLGTN